MSSEGMLGLILAEDVRALRLRVRDLQTENMGLAAQIKNLEENLTMVRASLREQIALLDQMRDSREFMLNTYFDWHCSRDAQRMRALRELHERGNDANLHPSENI